MVSRASSVISDLNRDIVLERRVYQWCTVKTDEAVSFLLTVFVCEICMKHFPYPHKRLVQMSIGFKGGMPQSRFLPDGTIIWPCRLNRVDRQHKSQTLPPMDLKEKPMGLSWAAPV